MSMETGRNAPNSYEFMQPTSETMPVLDDLYALAKFSTMWLEEDEFSPNAANPDALWVYFTTLTNLQLRSGTLTEELVRERDELIVALGTRLASGEFELDQADTAYWRELDTIDNPTALQARLDNRAETAQTDI